MSSCGFAARLRGPTSCSEGKGLAALRNLHAAASFAIATETTTATTAVTANAHIGDRGADVEVKPRNGA